MLPALIDIAIQADDDKAYATIGNKGKAPANGSKECTWYSKDHPEANKGHSWNECNKLKALNEKRKKEK